jgi:2-oxoglutarate ferredoxin oxidoreductase subunit delta
MALMNAPENTPVWVDEKKCKACDICVSVCPAGVLSMHYDVTSTLGAMVKIDHSESCIGCGNCELSCPDFAISVADKSEYKFAKLTNEAKERQEKIAENNYMYVGEK